MASQEFPELDGDLLAESSKWVIFQQTIFDGRMSKFGKERRTLGEK